MISRKITDGDIADKKVASLPTRPTAPAAFGGKGYTATELKEAFDKLPMFLVERYNQLIDDMYAEAENGVAGAIKTGISDSHTLLNLFSDIKNGNFTAYLAAPTGTVAEYLIKLREDINKIATRFNIKL